jgi:hypothetical protein
MTVDATPTTSNADSGVGLDTDPAIGESGNAFATAATIRFNSENGHIEARSDAAYPATNIAWTAGQKYRFRFQVNGAAHTYDAYVTAPGVSEQTIGTNLVFRSNYGSTSSLNNLRGAADPGGSVQVCLVSGPDGGNPTPTCGVGTDDVPYNQSFAGGSSFGMTADATPAVSNADSGVGLDTDPAVDEQGNAFATAATVRFNSENGHIEARSGSAYPATSITWVAGQKYRFRFQVNGAAHTYDAYVTAPGGSEQTIGTNLSFRSNYGSTSSLNNLRGAADPGGSIQVCLVSGPN